MTKRLPVLIGLALSLLLCDQSCAAPLPLRQHIMDEGYNFVSRAWGPYRVNVTGGGTLSKTVTINTHSGATLATIHSAAIYQIYAQELLEGEQSDLIVQTGAEVNLWGCATTYVFSRHGGVHAFAIITGGIGTFERLDRRGLQFVIRSSGVLEFACDVCHACSPNISVIFGLHKGKFVNQTRQFAWLARFDARKSRQKLFVDLHILDSENQPFIDQSIISDAGTYYASMIELGNERQGYAWIMRHLQDKTKRETFQLCAHAIRRRISEIPRMVITHQARQFVTAENTVFTN